MSETPCLYCNVDPQPDGFGTPRECAFKDGTFSEENWNCAALERLLDVFDLERQRRVYGEDESLDLVPAYIETDTGLYPHGWIVLTRYKRRGCVSSAVHVGDFYPAVPVTLALVETTLRGLQQRRT